LGAKSGLELEEIQPIMNSENILIEEVEVTGRCQRLNKEEHHHFYFSPNIAGVIKS